MKITKKTLYPGNDLRIFKRDIDLVHVWLKSYNTSDELQHGCALILLCAFINQQLSILSGV